MKGSHSDGGSCIGWSCLGQSFQPGPKGLLVNFGDVFGCLNLWGGGAAVTTDEGQGCC